VLAGDAERFAQPQEQAAVRILDVWIPSGRASAIEAMPGSLPATSTKMPTAFRRWRR
jgi:hypothetical protein